MIRDKQILAVIPARGGSKSIPGKNIKLLNGIPLIAYSIAAGLQSRYVDRVVVSTDDKEIAEVAEKYGAELPFMRPHALAGDDVTDLPVFQHCLDTLKQKEGYDPDIVIQLRPTSPFRPEGLVDTAIELFDADANCDCVRCVTPSGENPHKMWFIGDNEVMEPIMESRYAEPYNMPRQQLPATYWQTGHIEVIRKSTITAKNSLTGDVIKPVIVENVYAVDLDNLFQWSYAEYLLKNRELNIVKP